MLIAVEDFEGDPVKVADMEVPAVVVIDPGHGGTDSGTVDGGISEKDLTLEYSQELRDRLVDRLAERQPFHRVILTRSEDVFVALLDRTNSAINNGADILFSIHFNSNADTSARGVETHIERPIEEANLPNDPGDNINIDEDRTMATSLNLAVYTALHSVDTATLNRGIVNSGKFVTRDENLQNIDNYHLIRACLTEVEFLSNVAARQTLTGTNAESLQNAIAVGVANGIITDLGTQP